MIYINFQEDNFTPDLVPQDMINKPFVTLKLSINNSLVTSNQQSEINNGVMKLAAQGHNCSTYN